VWALNSTSLIVNNNTDVFWLQYNGYANVASAFNQSMMMQYERSATQADAALLANNVILGVALSLCLLVAAAVIAPAIVAVLREKHAVFDTFLEVPLPVIRALRQRVADRIAALRKAKEDAEAGEDVAGAGDSANYGDSSARITGSGTSRNVLNTACFSRSTATTAGAMAAAATSRHSDSATPRMTL
jgi:hypothetical protein